MIVRRGDDDDDDDHDHDHDYYSHTLHLFYYLYTYLFMIRYERSKQFDQLTFMLGEGKPPTEGFKDWRLLGVPGMRPTVIAFFVTIQGGSR